MTIPATVFLASSALIWTVDKSFHGDLWKTADVILTSEYNGIIRNIDQEDLPKDWRCEYTRVMVKFQIAEVLRGEYPGAKDDFYISSLFEEEKKLAQCPREFFADNHKRAFTNMPLSQIPNELPKMTFYKFLRWDAYGNLVVLTKVTSGSTFHLNENNSPTRFL